jgi:hypothetical protein
VTSQTTVRVSTIPVRRNHLSALCLAEGVAMLRFCCVLDQISLLRESSGEAFWTLLEFPMAGALRCSSISKEPLIAVAIAFGLRVTGFLY